MIIKSFKNFHSIQIKDNILKKDMHILKKGVKYIFPLPDIRTYAYKKNKVISSKL